MSAENMVGGIKKTDGQIRFGMVEGWITERK